MAGDHESEHPDEAEGGPVKSFLEHLEDLRWVLIKSLVALFVAVLLCLLAGKYVVGIVKWPLTRAGVSWPGTNQIVTVSFGTNRLGTFPLTTEQQKWLNLGTNRFVSVQLAPLVIGTNQVLGWQASSDPDAVADAQRLQIDLINLSPAGGFVVAFQVAIYGGAMLASPFIFYFVAAFIFPALKLRERKYIYRGLAFGGGLFLTGVAFCYFILMPLALTAAQMYSHWLGFGALQWRAEDYISFVCKFLLGMGLGFELPVVILTLVKIGLLDYRMLSNARRYMIIINLVLGAVLTTPEPFTQIVMFVPLQGLYEITVWIAWYWDQPDRRKARRALLLALLILLLMVWLAWLGYQHARPLAHLHLH
jgi:sec-independent protein translocase protein TatC